MSSPLSAFTAAPNPQMLAFMGAQSYLMMYMAGAGWQYGKRKISAKSNEEFNALTTVSLYKSMTTELKESIPSIEKSMNDMTPIVGTIVEQYGAFVKEIIAAMPRAVEATVQKGSVIDIAMNPPTTATGEPDYEKAITDILNQMIPIIPEAEGRLSYDSQIGQRTGDYGDAPFSQHTIDKQRAGQLTAAMQRIEQFKREQVRKKLNITRPIPQVHQIATASRTGTPKAGQTQILERNRLIKSLEAERIHLRDTQSRAYRYRNRLSSADQQVDIRKAQASFNRVQEQLTGLLKRYRW